MTVLSPEFTERIIKIKIIHFSWWFFTLRFRDWKWDEDEDGDGFRVDGYGGRVTGKGNGNRIGVSRLPAILKLIYA